MLLFLGVFLFLWSPSYAQTGNRTICEGLPPNTFVRDVRNCAGWFRCSANGPVAGTCPSPFLFNAEAQACDWEDRVTCFACPTTQPIISIPVDGSCTQFIRCVNGVANHHVCQEGLLFNEQTGQCDLESNVVCEVVFTCPPNIPPGQTISFRDNAQCHVFHVCAGQANPIRQECNPALHFDPVSQQCTFPHLTDCPAATTTTVNPGNPGNPTTTTQAPFVCARDGHHAHPTTCNSFIVCAAGEAHFFNCSEGLHFNSSTNQCDLPANANCVRK